MRQLILLFLMLLSAFLGLWTYKVKTPINRPNEYAEGYDPDAGAWWQGKMQVDDNWRLDPEIPLNYIPVPGENELYMVVDNNGNIIGYRQRTKQIDGSWLWTDVNPDIPANYEAVEGLENVYKVVMDDGSVKYYKYIRNDDDTFAFVEVDENGNPIDKDRDATTIDGKHVHITGNIYQRLDDHGVAIGYDKRVANGDGTFKWMDTEMPKLQSLDDMEGDWSLPEGGGNGNTVGLDLSGYESAAQGMQDLYNAGAGQSVPVYNIDLSGLNFPGGDTQQGSTGGNLQVINNSDGTHTETKIVRETKNINGKITTYETYVKSTYDDAGNLLSTQSEGPYEVSSQTSLVSAGGPLAGGSTSVESNIGGEVARVTGSYSFDQDVAGKLAAMVNAQRTANGLGVLNFTDEALYIAALRAADMAANDASSAPLPTYGNLSDMIGMFSLPMENIQENIWKTTSLTADDIHIRFQAVEASRDIRMDPNATQGGIAVAVCNGYQYICEVYY